MEVSLPPQLQEFIRAQVRTGKYVDEEEVVRDALRQMRSLVKAAEDPNVVSLVRDAIGIASQAQRDVVASLQNADRESTLLGEVVGHATSLANSAFEAMRKVPGAQQLDRIIRTPVEQVTAAAELGEVNAKAMRQNLEATAKALGLLTAILERVNAASRTVNSALTPPKASNGS
jgi:putative addiction module CopG family antidote